MEENSNLVVITQAQMLVILGCQKTALDRLIRNGRVPPPDIQGGRGRSSLWFLSSIESWNPEAARLAEQLISIKPISLNRALRCRGRIPGTKPKRPATRNSQGRYIPHPAPAA